VEAYVARGIIWKKSPWKCFFKGIGCHWHFENNGSKNQEKRKDIDKGAPASLSTPGESRLRKNNTVATVGTLMMSQEDLPI
jgi:hypothetical protein